MSRERTCPSQADRERPPSAATADGDHDAVQPVTSRCAELGDQIGCSLPAILAASPQAETEPVSVMRILVVDDEERFAVAVAQGLRAEGLAVDVAHDGLDGLAMANCGEYDAIVLDLMLPGLNGYMVCSELRAAQNWVPILVLTAMDDELDEAEALDCGADDYLAKPFSFVVLLARLRALLRRGAPPRPPVLVAGELALDPAAHRCWYGGSEVRLTTREFALLEYLMRRPGEVVSKAAILEHVWDSAWPDTSNVVEVYMGYVRKKLAAGCESCVIETVRGRGYRLAASGNG